MIRYHLDISVCFLMVIFGRRWHAYALVKSLSCVQLFMTLWTVAHQAPPSMGFSRQECWSGFSHFLLQGIFLTQRLNPGLSHRRQTLYHLSYQGRARKDPVSQKRDCGLGDKPMVQRLSDGLNYLY